VVGFGMGEKGDYHFEDLRIDAPSVTPVTVALRYHYDVPGRRRVKILDLCCEKLSE